MGRRTTGRPHLRYKDVCVTDIKAVDIDTMSWEGLAADRTKWRSALKQHLKTGEDKLMAAAADQLARRKEGSSSIRPETATPTLVVSAISDAARTQTEINKIKNKCIRMYHPWSSLTDGGLNERIWNIKVRVGLFTRFRCRISVIFVALLVILVN